MQSALNGPQSSQTEYTMQDLTHTYHQTSTLLLLLKEVWPLDIEDPPKQCDVLFLKRGQTWIILFEYGLTS